MVIQFFKVDLLLEIGDTLKFRYNRSIFKVEIRNALNIHDALKINKNFTDKVIRSYDYIEIAM